MSTAVIGAPGFRARSGRMVQVRENGTVTFDHANGYLSAETAMDAEEFYQHQRDLELGRWRWPENPHVVVYRREDGLLALDEQTGHTRFHDPKVMRFTRRNGSSLLEQALFAYAERHPERMPWEDAKPGEVWAVVPNGDAWVLQSGEFQFDDGSTLYAGQIKEAHRVYPAGDAS